MNLKKFTYSGGVVGNFFVIIITDFINGEIINWNYIGNLFADSLISGIVSIGGFILQKRPG